MTVKRRRYGKSGYGYTVDGERVPGVTKVLSMLPKDALVDWAAREAADHAVNHWRELSRLLPMERWNRIKNARWETSQPAAKRGTEVHRYAERWNEDEDFNPDVIPLEIRGYVEAYIDFYNTMEVRPLEGGTELVVASRTHRYCGTADLVGDLAALTYDGGSIPACRWLLEIKTTKGVWPESALQACAYEHAEVFCDPETPDDERMVEWLKIQRCGVVHLKSDAWSLLPLDTGPEVWDFFLHLKWLYDRQEDMPLWIGGPATVAAADQLAAATTS